MAVRISCPYFCGYVCCVFLKVNSHICTFSIYEFLLGIPTFAPFNFPKIALNSDKLIKFFPSFFFIYRVLRNIHWVYMIFVFLEELLKSFFQEHAPNIMKNH